ncbi:MAG: sensor histidine kinase, partial [Anaeromyxobacteraceae bacterium]
PPRAARLLALADGERRVLVAPAPRAHGDGFEMLLAANDDLAKVTRELAKRAAELEHARGELERLGTMRDSLTATLSHDLRGFLSSISLTAAILANAPQDEQATRRHAATILRNVERMAGLVGNLLDAVRLDQGGVTLHRERTSLPALARGTVESLEPVAAGAGVRLEVSSARDVVAEVDPVRFGQVLSNLLSNAIRHSPPGGLVRVEVEAGSALRVTVSDEGPGVPEALRATLFDRFRQGSRPGAAGLGLFIARELVQLHGGGLSLEDSGGPGARFVVELPREA